MSKSLGTAICASCQLCLISLVAMHHQCGAKSKPSLQLRNVSSNNATCAGAACQPAAFPFLLKALMLASCSCSNHDCLCSACRESIWLTRCIWMQAWNTTGDSYSIHPGDKPWISEMYGYSYACAAADVWHKVDFSAMLYPAYFSASESSRPFPLSLPLCCYLYLCLCSSAALLCLPCDALNTTDCKVTL